MKEKFQSWTNDINEDYKLILTNDLDSLFTVAVLKHLFGCQVGLFYDFKTLYSTKSERFDKTKLIGADLAIEDKEIKTFCNHVTRMTKGDTVNPMSANLNNFAKGVYGGGSIQSTTYFRKYGGSTALTVLSLYEAFDKLLLPNHKELTDEQKKILVSIDSYFLGAYLHKHYEGYDYFYRWQRVLELEMFQDIFDNSTQKELEHFQKDKKLKGSIFTKGTGLGTGLDLDYLKEHFPMLDFSLEITFVNYFELAKPINTKFYTGMSKHDLNGHVFSLSVINRDKVVYTSYPA
ncbi:hypothetical protein [Bacillus weihaiensis]|uniref:hypothetical protein n=1 Tax=Bacillus weihaiensis TaxID=1547283 RepID=UPI0011AB7BB6|nr:hypothetical protein [Bacillus weihaiensis]